MLSGSLLRCAQRLTRLYKKPISRRVATARSGVDGSWNGQSHDAKCAWAARSAQDDAPTPVFFSSCCAAAGCFCVAMMRELLDVVHQTVEVPLDIHLGLRAQREALEAFVVAQVRKHRLHRRHAPTVERLAAFAVDRLLH